MFLPWRFKIGPEFIAFRFETIGSKGGGCTQWTCTVVFGGPVTSRGCRFARRRWFSACTARRFPRCCGFPRRRAIGAACRCGAPSRSEEHTSELQSLMRTSYDVFCLKKQRLDAPALHKYRPPIEHHITT